MRGVVLVARANLYGHSGTTSGWLPAFHVGPGCGPTADIRRIENAVQMPAGRRADSGPLPGAGSRPRQMVHDRHPLPCPMRGGDADGRGQPGCLALVSRNPGRREEPRGQPGEWRAHRRTGRDTRTAHRGHGPDGDRHPGDLAGAAPDLLRRRPGSRARHRARDQRFHRRYLRPISRPLRRARHGAVPGAGSGRRRTRPAAQIIGLSRHRDHDPCRRRGSVGRTLSQDLRPLRGAGPAGVHALGRVYRGRALCRPLFRQRDRQPARYDGGAPSPDLWRRAARLSEPQAGRRRMAAAFCRPIRAASTTPPRPAPMPASRSHGCRRPI